MIAFAPLDLPQCKRPFRFEEMWLSNPSCEETIQATQYHTSSSDPSNEILKNIERCGPDLGWWNRNVFGSVRQELIRKKELLHRVENVAMILGDNSRV